MPARSATRSRSLRGALSPDGILDAALAVARREGVEGLTIRKLATELRVTPMAVYHHFANKESILLGLIDRVVGEAAVTEHAVPPIAEHAWLIATFGRMYDALVEQPGVIALLGQSMLVGPHAREVLEEVLAVLERTGLDRRSALRGFHALMSFTLGAASLRVRVLVDADADEVPGQPAAWGGRDTFEGGLQVVLAGLGIRTAPSARSELR